MARHDQPPVGDPAEADPGIIGLVADQDDQPFTATLGDFQRVAHQPAADPLALQIGMHRKRPEQQRRYGALADEHPPIADDAGELHLVGAGDEGQPLDRLLAFAQAIGGLRPTPEAEADVEQALDPVMIAVCAGRESEGDRGHREVTSERLKGENTAATTAFGGEQGLGPSSSRFHPCDPVIHLGPSIDRRLRDYQKSPRGGTKIFTTRPPAPTLPRPRRSGAASRRSSSPAAPRQGRSALPVSRPWR